MPHGLKRYYGRGDLHFGDVQLLSISMCITGRIKAKLNYVHVNLVNRELVKHPKDWPWSSWPHCMKGKKSIAGD